MQNWCLPLYFDRNLLTLPHSPYISQNNKTKHYNQNQTKKHDYKKIGELSSWCLHEQKNYKLEPMPISKK